MNIFSSGTFFLRRFFPAGLALLAFLVASPAVWAESENAVKMSLEQVFDRIESQNLSLLIQNEAVVGQLQSSRRARAGVLPSLDFEGSQTRSQNAIGARQRVVGNSFAARLSARYPLVDARAITEARVGKFDYEISQLDFAVTVQDVLQLAGNAYFQHLRNLARADVIEANLARDKVLLELAVNQYRAGVATPIDVTRAEVRLANDEKDRLQQETTVYLSGLDLKRLLDLDLDVDLQLEKMEPNQMLLDSLSGVALLSARPEYEKATRTLERNRFARKMAPWERAPTVNLIGQYGFGGDTFWDGTEEEWLIGFTFNIPIFDGWRIQANILQADSLVRQQQYAVRQLENQLGADYRFSLQNVRSLFQQIDLARKQVMLGEKELELARTRFQQGVADNRDLVEAQANLAFAQDQLVESIYRYNLARLEYARVRGNVRLVLVR